MSERWVDIDGFEGYKVSDRGRVKTTDGNIKSIRVLSNGYRQVQLSRDKKRKYRYVHRLVAINFISKPYTSKHEINHIDGNKANNVVGNLEWVTRSQNMNHAIRTGLLKTIGESHHMSKIRVKDVHKIRSLYAGGAKQQAIADIFGIGQVQVSRIVNRKRWASI